MKGLFDALEARFDANPALRLKGRKLFLGFDNARVNETKPYTEVYFEVNSDESSFDDNAYEYALTFRYHAKDLRTGSATDWIDEMTETFKDATFNGSWFDAGGCTFVHATGPTLNDGLFDADIHFTLLVQEK